MKTIRKKIVLAAAKASAMNSMLTVAKKTRQMKKAESHAKPRRAGKLFSGYASAKFQKQPPQNAILTA